MKEDSKIVCIATLSREREADLARMALESHGIECLVAKDDCGGMRPHLQFATGIRVLVGECDAARARAILDEMNRAENR